MILAVSPDSTIYELVVFVHIFASIVGFGSTFVWPVLSVKARNSGDPGLMLKVSEMIDEAGHVLSAPFIWAAGGSGLLLVILGATADPAYWEFSDTWISIAMTSHSAASAPSTAS